MSTVVNSPKYAKAMIFQAIRKELSAWFHAGCCIFVMSFEMSHHSKSSPGIQSRCKAVVSPIQSPMEEERPPINRAEQKHPRFESKETRKHSAAATCLFLGSTSSFFIYKLRRVKLPHGVLVKT